MLVRGRNFNEMQKEKTKDKIISQCFNESSVGVFQLSRTALLFTFNVIARNSGRGSRSLMNASFVLLEIFLFSCFAVWTESVNCKSSSSLVQLFAKLCRQEAQIIFCLLKQFLFFCLIQQWNWVYPFRKTWHSAVLINKHFSTLLWLSFPDNGLELLSIMLSRKDCL